MAIFFIKKIWQSEVDDSVHSQFIRFSRGKFDNRFVMTLSKGSRCKLSSTFDLANNIVSFVAMATAKINVNGILLTRENPESMLKSVGIAAPVKKKAMIFETEINAELTSEQIKSIAEKAYFMLFDIQADGIVLKMKKKLPRPAKAGGEKANDKFCILEADLKYWQKLKEEFAFDVEDFKKANISHTIEIKDIILPKDEKNFDAIRLMAKRKGTITRKIIADTKEKIVAKDFIA